MLFVFLELLCGNCGVKFTKNVLILGQGVTKKGFNGNGFIFCLDKLNFGTSERLRGCLPLLSVDICFTYFIALDLSLILWIFAPFFCSSAACFELKSIWTESTWLLYSFGICDWTSSLTG